MTDLTTGTAATQALEGIDLAPVCTVHVCTSCRPAGTAREPKENRPGFKLYHRLRRMVETGNLRHRVEVRPTECLSVCPRPCGLAITLPGSWTYLFGDQDPDLTTSEVIDCVKLYLESPNGFMPRAQRPKAMRSSILGRVPPIERASKCT